MKKTLPHVNITRSFHFIFFLTLWSSNTIYVAVFALFKTRVISQLRLTTTSLNTERERERGGTGGTGAEEEKLPHIRYNVNVR